VKDADSSTRIATGHALTLLILSLLVLTACRDEKATHQPVQAASDANRFLKALYFEEDYPKALELADAQLRQSVDANGLRQLVEGIGQQHGKLKTLRADSYLMTPGSTMELFYIGEYEKGILYHRLVLMGNASSGYRVSGVWYQPEAYAAQPLRRSFNQDIQVK
jgi:hypothetical protein